MNEIKLTEDQQVAVDAIKVFLKSPETEPFTLSGVGGAGKTTCIREAIKDSINVVGATVSHSAKGVLSESLEGTDTKCYTIAQLLGLTQYISEDGEVSFVPGNKDPRRLPIRFADVLIIDECSMIDQTTMTHILAHKKVDCKLIFMGE